MPILMGMHIIVPLAYSSTKCNSWGIIVGLRIMIKQVAGDMKLCHRILYVVIFWRVRFGYSFGNIHMAFGVEHFLLYSFLGYLEIWNKSIDGCCGHVELLFHVCYRIPFRDACVHGFLGKVRIYMFLAPIRLATLKHFRKSLVLGNLVQPRLADAILLKDFRGCVELGDRLAWFSFPFFVVVVKHHINIFSFNESNTSAKVRCF